MYVGGWECVPIAGVLLIVVLGPKPYIDASLCVCVCVWVRVGGRGGRRGAGTSSSFWSSCCVQGVLQASGTHR